MSKARELLEKAERAYDIADSPHILVFEEKRNYIMLGIGYTFAALVMKMFEIENEQEQAEKEVSELNKKRSTK